MDTPTISSVDADGNVVIATTSTTTIEQLSSDRDAAQTESVQLGQQINDQNTYTAKLQAKKDMLDAIVAAKQGLIDAATPLQALAAAQVAPAQDTPQS